MMTMTTWSKVDAEAAAMQEKRARKTRILSLNIEIIIINGVIILVWIRPQKRTKKGKKARNWLETCVNLSGEEKALILGKR